MTIIRSVCLSVFLASAPNMLLAADQTAPTKSMKVAFAVSEGVNVIDLAGPWEVFQDTMVADAMVFELFTVSEKAAPVEMTGGLRMIPGYTFADAPHPDIVVVPAQAGSPALLDWLRARRKIAES